MEFFSTGGLNFLGKGEGSAVVAYNSEIELPEVIIPKQVQKDGMALSVVSIGDDAFFLNGTNLDGTEKAKRLRKLGFARDSQVTEFRGRAFQNSGIEELQIPPKLDKLDPDTFRHTPQLRVVTVVDNPMCTVSGGVLYSKDRKTIFFVPRNTVSDNYKVPQGVVVIGPWAFGDCTQIKQIELPPSVKTIETGAFSGSGLKTFRLPATVTEIGNEIFHDCGDLTEVTFDAGITIRKIPESAFEGTAIVNMVVPASVFHVQQRAFAQTPKLTEVKFADGSQCQFIMRDVFWESGIKTLSLPKGLILMLDNFFACGDLEKVNPGDQFAWENGMLWDKLRTEIYFARRTLEGRIEIPDSVTEIHGNAFTSCTKVTSVHFNQSSKLAKIGEWAFFGSGLTEIAIPSGVKEILPGTFSDCENLKSVTFLEGTRPAPSPPRSSKPEPPVAAAPLLYRIGAEAFRRSGLESFEGPPNLIRLDWGAFSYCPALRTVVLPAGVEAIQQDTFLSCDVLQVVRSQIPAGRSIRVDERAFPDRFDRANFRHTNGVNVIWGDESVVSVKPDSAGAVRYEKAKPPGTNKNDYTLSQEQLAQRVEVAGTRRRTSYKARHKTTGEISWIKEFNSAEDAIFWREQEILSQLVHPVLLGLIGVVLPVDGVGYLVTEYMPNGSLDALIKDRARYEAMSSTAKAKIAVGIAIGMRSMHAAGVLHRDLKPSNILLDENNEPRIGDWRTARIVGLDVTMTGGVGTSHLYSAPEIAEQHYDEKVDVFSYAMIWWEIITGKSVMSGFPGGTDPGMIVHRNRVKSGVRPHLDLGAMADGILESLWDTDPDNRFSFAEFLDYAESNHYELLDGADPDELRRYVARLQDFETKHPAPDLKAYDEEE
jgi:hypothetical protein